jgi:hypothetical protein
MPVPIIRAVAAVVVVAVLFGVVINRQKDPQRRATALTRTGAVLMAVFTVLGGAFIGGYAMEEPGGSAGLTVLLAWAGWLLLALATLPLLITVLGRSGPIASLAAASVVPLITGVVYLLAARMARGSATPRKVRPAAV